MPKQPAFSGLQYAMEKKLTRREKFLAEMEPVVPKTRLLALIEPHYPEADLNGERPPSSLGTMLRVYFLKRLYALICHPTPCKDRQLAVFGWVQG